MSLAEYIFISILILMGIPFVIGSLLAKDSTYFKLSFEKRKYLVTNEQLNIIEKQFFNKTMNFFLLVLTMFTFTIYCFENNFLPSQVVLVFSIKALLCFYFVLPFGYYFNINKLNKSIDEDSASRLVCMLNLYGVKCVDVLGKPEAYNLRNIHFDIVKQTLEKARDEMKKDGTTNNIKSYLNKK